jgi:hypothetical protein
MKERNNSGRKLLTTLNQCTEVPTYDLDQDLDPVTLLPIRDSLVKILKYAKLLKP